MDGLEFILCDALMKAGDRQHHPMEFLEVRAIRNIVVYVADRLKDGMQKKIALFRVIKTDWLIQL